MNSLSVENAAEFAQKTVLTIVNMNEKDVDFLKQYSSPLMCSVCLCKSCRLVILTNAMCLERATSPQKISAVTRCVVRQARTLATS